MSDRWPAALIAALILILPSTNGAPALAQSSADICDAYRDNYDREQDKINRMKNEPYKSIAQRRLNEKRARLERDCAGATNRTGRDQTRGDQIRRDEAEPGRVANLPGYLRVAKDKDHARFLARQAYETRLEFIDRKRQDALNAYRVNMARCAGSDACVSATVAGAVRRQSQLDQEARDAAQRLSRDLQQIQDTIQLPGRAQ